MSRIASLWAAVVTGLLSTFVIPATAWADESGLDELTKRRLGFGGVLGALCCLAVVGVIVLVVFMVMKSRKR